MLAAAVIGLGLGLGLAAGYSTTRHVTYSATATVLPAPLIGSPLGPDTLASNATAYTVAISTEAGLVDTPAVAAIASENLQTSVPRPSDHIVVTVPPNSGIIRIRYVSSTAEQAQAGAQAFADAFLEYRHTVATTSRSASLATLNTQMRQTMADLRRTSARAALDPTSFAAQRRQIFIARAESLKTQVGDTRALSTDPGRSVTRARLPLAADGFSSAMLMVAGSVLGLLMGLALAVWLVSRRTRSDVGVDDERSAVPLLAQIPAEADHVQRLVTAEAGSEPAQEAYRRLRASLVARAPAPGLIAVASIGSAGSAALVAVNLGVALARAGFRVTVADASPGEQVSRVLLDAQPGPGLAEVLTGKAQLPACLQDLHGLRYVAPGSDLGGARELLAGPALVQTLQKLGRGRDYVLVAAAEISSSDADAVALACGAAVIVVQDGASSSSETALAVDRFSALGVSTVGVIGVAGASSAHAPGRDTPSGRNSGDLHKPAGSGPVSDGTSIAEESVAADD